ncbi:MAG: hypothetical protein EB090_01320 [Verrucomicrobia bacterium]|nr:hypothetical protein [Verrucomicrobiota bacterium]
MDMKAFWVTLSMGMALTLQAQESGPSRLEAAETGEKDVAWPRKPDNRLSSLSGKMKDFREIPNQDYGGAKEFRSDRLYEDRQASSLAAVPMWSMSESPVGKKDDTSLFKDSSTAKPSERNHFDPESARREEMELREERQLSRHEAMGWASRTSRMGQATDGSLQMYEGRLTRVRHQVSHESNSADRDLGEGRREKYSPEEVRRLLQQQPGLPEIKEMVRPALPVRAESPAASRPLAAGS